MVALIPARVGSKRVPGKNIRPLGGHPLIAYSIASALESGVFARVIVSTDSPEIAEIARSYGAEVPFLRPAEFAGDTSPDIEWVDFTLNELDRLGEQYDCFSILRPTSPFRKKETIQRAWAEFSADASADSLRAVELCSQHPGKMWVIRGEHMLPLLPFGPEEVPWHSTPYQALPRIYVQNASLEIARTDVVRRHRTIAGVVIRPFLTVEEEGLDINSAADWERAETLLDRGVVSLPPVPTAEAR